MPEQQSHLRQSRQCRQVWKRGREYPVYARDEEPGRGSDEGVRSDRAQDSQISGDVFGCAEPSELRLPGRGYQLARYGPGHHEHQFELPQRIGDVAGDQLRVALPILTLSKKSWVESRDYRREGPICCRTTNITRPAARRLIFQRGSGGAI